MRTAFSFLAMFFAVGLGTFLIPTERLLHSLTDTDDLVASARGSDLYGRLEEVIARRVRTDYLDALNGTVLSVDSAEISRNMRSAFPEEWFYRNMEILHRGMIAGNGATAALIVSDRKELLIENLLSLIFSKMQQLPECDTRSMLRGTLDRWTTDRSVRKLIPPCRPSPAVESRLRPLFLAGLRSSVELIPDTLDLNRVMQGSGGNLAGAFRELHLFVSAFAVVLYIVLMLLVAGIVLINLNDRQRLFIRTGTTFLLTGLLIGLGSVLLGYFFDRDWADSMNPNEVSVQAADTTVALGVEFGGVLIGFFKSWLGQYFVNLQIGAFVLILIGSVGLLMPRFMPPPDVPLRGS